MPKPRAAAPESRASRDADATSHPPTQCREEVKIHKGVGFRTDEVHRTKYYCLRDKGHAGPHSISMPCPEDAEDW